MSLPGVGGGHSSQFGVTWDETLVKPDADVGIPAKGQPSHLGSLALDKVTWQRGSCVIRLLGPIASIVILVPGKCGRTRLVLH